MEYLTSKYSDFTSIMSKIILPLTSKQVKEAKPKQAVYKLYDGGGLILAVYPTGKKVWRLDYFDLNKKRKTFTIGDAAYISLADARKKREELKGNLANEKSIDKKDAVIFETVFYEWVEKWRLLVVESTYKRAKSAIERDCFPVLQNMEVSKIRPKDIVAALDPLDKRCSYETLKKVKSSLKLCFDYAIARGLCEMNPVPVVTQAAFTQTKKGNYRTLPLTEIYRIHEYFRSERNSIITRKCTEFILRTLARASEATQSKWSEIEDGIWIVPEHRMKMRREHIVPLSTQSLAILEEMSVFKSTDYIFQNHQLNNCIHSETPNTSFKRFGINSTIHGLRTLASTVLNESGLFEADIIEACLAHQDKNAVRSTYNKALYTEKRRELLQWWSDFIDMCDTERNNLKALKKFNIV